MTKVEQKTAGTGQSVETTVQVCSDLSFGLVQPMVDGWWMGKKVKEQKVFQIHRYCQICL